VRDDESGTCVVQGGDPWALLVDHGQDRDRVAGPRLGVDGGKLQAPGLACGGGNGIERAEVGRDHVGVLGALRKQLGRAHRDARLPGRLPRCLGDRRHQIFADDPGPVANAELDRGSGGSGAQLRTGEQQQRT